MLTLLPRDSGGGELPDPPEASPAETAEYEIVMGRRQVAGVLFVATIIVAVFCAISYVAGKAASPAKVVSKELIVPLADVTPAPAREAPVLEATIVKQPAPAPAPEKPVSASAPEPPLFAEPVNGSVYIQMGAVEKGIAIILAEGLRKREFQAFVAPGPNEQIFRVLIGPLATPAAYQKAKDGVDRIGLSTFARKYQK